LLVLLSWGKIDAYVATAGDIYNPHGWWREAKQIRWVLAEYGAWIYYCWKALEEGGGFKPAAVESGQARLNHEGNLRLKII
jgi:hypothetical protein